MFCPVVKANTFPVSQSIVTLEAAERLTYVSLYDLAFNSSDKVMSPFASAVNV